MTMALLSQPPLAGPARSSGTGTPDRPATLRTRADDRWQRAAAPVGRFSAAMVLVLLASVAIHALVVATALIASDTPPVGPHQEIAVEIVQEPSAAVNPVPTTAKTVTSGAANEGPKVAPAEPPIKLRKSDPDQAAAPKPAEPEPVVSKPVEPKSIEPKSVEPKPVSPEPEKPVARAPEPPKPASAALDDDLQTLKSELAALKQEQEALRAAASSRASSLSAPSSRTPSPLDAARTDRAPGPSVKSVSAPNGLRQAASLKDLGIDDGGVGPLAGSTDAVALPGTGADADETVGYQAIVFSQLAKAKGIGGRQGIPASAGVRFAIDEVGRLLSAVIVSPSGEPSLDLEALAIVRKAAPFPPPPEGAQRVFVANVNFTPMTAVPGR